MSLRRCDTEHLREYPDCYEECDYDKCVGIDLSQLSEAEAGAYEVIDGKLVKATQAISEKDGKATILQFGEVVEEEYIPIEEACAGCKHDGFKTIEKCQEQQGKVEHEDSPLSSARISSSASRRQWIMAKTKVWKVRVIKPDGTEEGWQGDRHPTLEEMQGWVGGYIEHVVVNLNGRKCDALVNEEGKLQGLPVNAKGTEMYVYGAEDPIVGNIAIFEEGRLE